MGYFWKKAILLVIRNLLRLKIRNFYTVCILLFTSRAYFVSQTFYRILLSDKKLNAFNCILLRTVDIFDDWKL